MKKTKIDALRLCYRLIQLKRKLHDGTFGKLKVKFNKKENHIELFEKRDGDIALESGEVGQIVNACTVLSFYIKYSMPKKEFVYHIF